MHTLRISLQLDDGSSPQATTRLMTILLALARDDTQPAPSPHPMLPLPQICTLARLLQTRRQTWIRLQDPSGTMPCRLQGKVLLLALSSSLCMAHSPRDSVVGCWLALAWDILDVERPTSQVAQARTPHHRSLTPRNCEISVQCRALARCDHVPSSCRGSYGP